MLWSTRRPAAPCAAQTQRGTATALPRSPPVEAARGTAPSAGGSLAAWPLALRALPVGCLAGALSGRHRARPQRAAVARGGLGRMSPTNLYELLGVRMGAGQGEIKDAYRSKLKISHPDVAGEESSELMILLNDAYGVLGYPGERCLYDGTLTQRDPSKPKVETSTDLGPTWKRSRDPLNSKPVWRGTPRSISHYDKLPEEDRGEMWKKQKYVYVNPFDCVGCYQCFSAAPKTFMISNVHGKALAYNQWGDPEVEIHWAIEACPVDCISWVSREELQYLEHVTALYLYENNGQMVCATQARPGTLRDPFTMANAVRSHMRREEEQAKLTAASDAISAADNIERRIERVFEAMPYELKLLGWPSYAVPAGGP